MRKLLFVGLLGVVLASCSTRTGHLVGASGRPVYYPEIPLGMIYVPAGSYQMGENDLDVPFLHQTRAKTVSVQAFYMDQTEISNNEYRQFVEWVRDSIARDKIYLGLAEDEDADRYINYQERYFDEGSLEFVDYDPSDRELNRSIFSLNWDRRFDYYDEEIVPILADMYYPQPERYYKRREIDVNRLMFRYYWIDYRCKTKTSNKFRWCKLRSF
jgi:hypothetical protein